MKIYNLADKLDYLDNVVDWLYNEWGNHEGSGNRNYWESWVRSSLSQKDIPQTFIAVEKNILIATFSLWRCDLQSRQDLFPWFGGLYVNSDYRNQGYGKQMQLAAFDILRELGYKKVFCFAEFSDYYENMGWVFEEMIPDEKGEMVRLYSYKI